MLVVLVELEHTVTPFPGVCRKEGTAEVGDLSREEDTQNHVRHVHLLDRYMEWNMR